LSKNRDDGVLIDGASNNIIGGILGQEGNIISNNGNNGVHIRGTVTPAATLNLVRGNLIGVAGDGNQSAPNANRGILIERAATSNKVGGAVQFRNVISANGVNGVLVAGKGPTDNAISSNFIGLGLDGTSKLGNGGDGVRIDTASDNTIGGNLA